MMPVEGEAGRSFRFSTDDLPEVARVEAVRELHERTALPGKIEPLEPLPNCLIRVDITKHALPGLGVMSGTLAGVRQAARSRAGASGSEDDLLLAINLSGRSIARQYDTELKLENGDAMLATRGSEGFSIIRPMPVRFMGLRVPRDTLVPLAGRLDDAPLQLIPRGTEVLNLLVAYAGGLFTSEHRGHRNSADLSSAIFKTWSRRPSQPSGAVGRYPWDAPSPPRGCVRSWLISPCISVTAT